jgi:hypothetical protein
MLCWWTIESPSNEIPQVLALDPRIPETEIVQAVGGEGGLTSRDCISTWAPTRLLVYMSWYKMPANNRYGCFLTREKSSSLQPQPLSPLTSFAWQSFYLTLLLTAELILKHSCAFACLIAQDDSRRGPTRYKVPITVIVSSLIQRFAQKGGTSEVYRSNSIKEGFQLPEKFLGFWNQNFHWNLNIIERL